VTDTTYINSTQLISSFAAPTDATSIRVDNVTKIYRLYDRHIDRLKESFHPLRRKYHRDFYALDAVSFEVKKGETVGIIGRNGSGKSTLLKIITGVLTPTSGGVIVNGTIAALLELAAGFNPELTGIDNIYLNGTIMGFSEQQIKAKLDDILAFADIGDFEYQPIKTYSSGMLVRLAFAVAVNVEPDILIVDEALAVGDINFQAKCYKKFNSFREQGKTILFVTHALDSIIRYCNRAVVLEQGRIISKSPPKEAVDIYKKLMVGCYDYVQQDELEKGTEQFLQDNNVSAAIHQNLTIDDSRRLDRAALYSIDTINNIPIDKQNQPLQIGNIKGVIIRGWAADERVKDISGGVIISIDGRDYKAKYGIERLDIADIHHNARYRYSGFECRIPASEITDGRHDLSIKIVTHDGGECITPQETISFISYTHIEFSQQVFKTQFSINPAAVIYGDQRAEIVDFGIFDGKQKPAQHLMHGEKCYIMMKVKFNEQIDQPIFAFTLKDIKGLEITGTNTYCKKIPTGVMRRGDIVLVEFYQTLNMQAGHYALSLGCTNYEQDQLVVYHRLYDIVLFEVISPDVFVGFYDLKPEIKVEVIQNYRVG
jgi:ABC-type polysaccharide/polyol phosphate transport system ATPase subunit